MLLRDPMFNTKGLVAVAQSSTAPPLLPVPPCLSAAVLLSMEVGLIQQERILRAAGAPQGLALAATALPPGTLAVSWPLCCCCLRIAGLPYLLPFLLQRMNEPYGLQMVVQPAESSPLHRNVI